MASFETTVGNEGEKLTAANYRIEHDEESIKITLIGRVGEGWPIGFSLKTFRIEGFRTSCLALGPFGKTVAMLFPTVENRLLVQKVVAIIPVVLTMALGSSWLRFISRGFLSCLRR